MSNTCLLLSCSILAYDLSISILCCGLTISVLSLGAIGLRCGCFGVCLNCGFCLSCRFLLSSSLFLGVSLYPMSVLWSLTSFTYSCLRWVLRCTDNSLH